MIKKENYNISREVFKFPYNGNFETNDNDIQEKSLKGFRKLTELKNSGPGPRVFVYRGKNEKPTVVRFCMRNDLDTTIEKLKNKFN